VNERVDVSVIIVNWNTCDLLRECLRSVYDSMGELVFEVLVVDNASTDGSVEMVRSSFPQVRLLANAKNVGFARGNNQALALSRGHYALLLNSDALLLDGATQALVDLADAKPQAGIVGAQLLNVDGSFQASYTPFPNLWREFLILSGVGRMVYGRRYPSRGPEEEKGPQMVDYVEGACMLVRRAAVEKVGGLDEGYFMYAEDVDWCYAMQKRGWQVWYQPAAKVIHVGGGSSQNRRPQREADLYSSRVRFFSKHYGPRAAAKLWALIYVSVMVKGMYHWVLCKLSGGRHGRVVVSTRDLGAVLSRGGK